MNNKSIVGTDWMFHSLMVTESFGLLRKGRLVLVKSGGRREDHTWEAKYEITGKWKIAGQGAIMQSGGRAPAAEAYPFSLDGLVNLGVIKILSDWLDANAKNNDCLGIPPPGQNKPTATIQTQQSPKPAVTPTVATKPVVWVEPIPAVAPIVQTAPKALEIPNYLEGGYPPVKPKIETKPETKPVRKTRTMKQQKPANQALIDSVVSAVLKMRGKTKDEMMDGGSRECTRERQIVAYVLKHYDQSDSVVQKVIGAMSVAGPYANCKACEKLLKTDKDLKAEVDVIIAGAKKFVTDTSNEEVVSRQATAQVAVEKPVIPKAKGPKGKKTADTPKRKSWWRKTASAKGDQRPASHNGNGHTSKAELTDVLVYLLSEGVMMNPEKLAPIFKTDVNSIYMSVGKVQARFHGDKQIVGVVEELRKLDLSSTIAKLT